MLRVFAILSGGVFLAAWLGMGCSPEPSTSHPADNIDAYLDAVIQAHGGAVLDAATVSFTFREYEVQLQRDDGVFEYRRSFTDTDGQRVTEGITNNDVYRVVEGDTLSLDAEERSEIETAVNGIAYFALLPYPLQDPSVNATYAGPDTVRGVAYHRVGVGFDAEAGDDYQDEFMYWFDADTHAMDYMAYAFGVGGPEEDQGTRFREAYRVHNVEGVRLADYYNYTVEDLPIDKLQAYPDYLETDTLTLVSTVDLEGLRITPLN